jgi:hypothetical protein
MNKEREKLEGKQEWEKRKNGRKGRGEEINVGKRE